MLTLLLALAAANPALAESGVTFRADLPVRFYIDGQRVSSTANVRPVSRPRRAHAAHREHAG